MSDLATFGGYARTMATAQHKPECCSDVTSARGVRIRNYPAPGCPGCVPDSDRALWTQIADEIEAHLNRADEAGLFA